MGTSYKRTEEDMTKITHGTRCEPVIEIAEQDDGRNIATNNTYIRWDEYDFWRTKMTSIFRPEN